MCHIFIWLYIHTKIEYQVPVDRFEGDEAKNSGNIRKHGVSFFDGQRAFLDPNRVVTKDVTHSSPEEERYFCFGKIGNNVLTIRFIFRGNVIRIFGAGYWRKGGKIYEQEN